MIAATAVKIADLAPAFGARVAALIEDCPHRIGITSGRRSRADQQRLYDAYQAYKAGRGPKANPANRPGTSPHEVGRAADLAFGGDAGRQWVHQHAHEYGLHFPIPHEPWHVESDGRPIDLEDDVALSDEDVQRVADEVHKRTKADAVTILRATDQPSIKGLAGKLDAVLAGITSLVQRIERLEK